MPGAASGTGPAGLWRRCMNSRLLIGLLMILAVLPGCSEKKKEKASEAPQQKAAEADSRVRHGTNGEVMVVLDAPTRALMGLRTTTLKPFSLPRGFEAVGRVVDPTPLAALAGELATAEAASVASAAELARLQTLVAESNASERALEAAKATAGRDKALLDAVHLRLVAGWGKIVAGRDDLDRFVRSLASMDTALVELNVSAANRIEDTPSGARLSILGETAPPVEARFLSLAPNVDPQFQGRGFWFLVDQNRGRLAPGAAISGRIDLPGEPQAGLELPRDAVVRHVGADWIYVQRTEDSFERILVRLGGALAEGWFIANDKDARLKPGDSVVISGAQQLLSEELKGQQAE